MKDSQLNPTLKPLVCPVLEAGDDLDIILDDTVSEDGDALSCSCFVIDFENLTVLPKETLNKTYGDMSPKEQHKEPETDFNGKSSFAHADVSTTFDSTHSS